MTAATFPLLEAHVIRSHRSGFSTLNKDMITHIQLLEGRLTSLARVHIDNPVVGVKKTSTLMSTPASNALQEFPSRLLSNI